MDYAEIRSVMGLTEPQLDSIVRANRELFGYRNDPTGRYRFLQRASTVRKIRLMDQHLREGKPLNDLVRVFQPGKTSYGGRNYRIIREMYQNLLAGRYNHILTNRRQNRIIGGQTGLPG